MAEILLAEGPSAATPSSNIVSIYAKTDSKPYYKGDDGIEHTFASVDEALAIAYAIALG